jgi:archaellum component FlaC
MKKQISDVINKKQHAYSDALNAARDEYARLTVEYEANSQEISARLERQSDIEKELSKLSGLIEGLSGHLGHDSGLRPVHKPKRKVSKEPELGLTDAIRWVLRKSSERALTVVEIRDELKELGYDTARLENSTTSIHITLSRLAEKGEVEQLAGRGKSKKKAYKWAGLDVRVRRPRKPVSETGV